MQKRYASLRIVLSLLAAMVALWGLASVIQSKLSQGMQRWHLSSRPHTQAKVPSAQGRHMVSAGAPSAGGGNGFKARSHGLSSVVKHEAALGPAQGREFVTQMRILSRLTRVPTATHRVVDTEHIAQRPQP